MIGAWTGEREQAIQPSETLLEILIGLPYDLKLSRCWDPLRDDPRFKKIVASLPPKETATR